MIILGVDPGTAETGYGIIKIPSPKSQIPNKLELVTFGCIKTSVDHDMPKRLLLLRSELKKIIKAYKPNCMALEQLFFGQNSKSAMQVGQARGVVMLCTAEAKIPVHEYQGLSVKLALSGNGRAKKRQIQSVVRKILGLRRLPRPDHAADALGVAIHHAFKNILKT